MITIAVGSTVFIIVMIIGVIAWIHNGFEMLSDRKKVGKSRTGWRNDIDGEPK